MGKQTLLGLFLWSKTVSGQKKISGETIEKPDHLIRKGSYDPVGVIDTRLDQEGRMVDRRTAGGLVLLMSQFCPLRTRTTVHLKT